MATLDEWDYRIKLAFRALVDAIGTNDAAAVIVSAAIGPITGTSIHRYGDIAPGNDSMPPIRIVMALEAAAGLPIVTAVMAQRTGHEIVSAAASNDDACMMTAQADLCRLHGESTSAFLEAFADRKLSPNEIKRLNGLYSQIIATIGRQQQTMATQLRAVGEQS